MEYRTEDGDPLLKLRFSIVTHPIHWYYIIMQQIKQSTINYIYITQMVVTKEENRRNRKKVQDVRCMVYGA